MAHCYPCDLLQLSRASKDLRRLLLAKRNKDVWVRARNNLDYPLPRCPEEIMSEPRYASLIFDDCCMVNGQSHIIL